MRRLLASVAVLLSLGLFASGTLNSYSYSGHRWASADVPFFVNPVSRTLSENTVLTALQAAAGHWGTQSGAAIRYYYAGRTSGSTLQNNGLNEVFLRNASNGSLSAATYYWYGPDGKLVDADTVFYEASYQFFGGSTGCTSSGLYLEDVATHEFGHSLGLGHSSDTSATMHPTMPSWCTQAWRTLASDDIAGIRAAYPPLTGSVPIAPLGLVAILSVPAQSAVRLTWVDTATNESSYVIQRSANGSSYVQVGQVAANITTFTNTGLSAATNYWFRVYSTNNAGPSTYSNTVSIKTATAVLAPPAAPSGPSPANGATGVLTTPVVGWTAASGALKYDVYFGGTSSPPLLSSGQTATTWATPRLGPGKRYYWRVVAKNSVGATSGPVWSFTTRSIP